MLFAVVAFLLIVHYKYRMTLKPLAATLLMGILASFAAYQIKQMGFNFGIINKSDPIFNFTYAFFAIGLCMQLLQFLFLKVLIYPSPHFKSHLFGLIYCIWISIAALIPELFTLNNKEYPSLVILNIPGHISTAIIMGYFISMAKFSRDSNQNFTYLNSGLASAIIIQGLHEFFILEGQFPNLIVLILGTGFLSLILIAHLFRQENNTVKTIKNQKLEELYPEEEL